MTARFLVEEGGFEPFSRSSLGRSFRFGCALDYGGPCGARYSLASFEKVVGKRGFDPPNVVYSWLIVTESEVGHRTFFIAVFVEDCSIRISKCR